MPTHSCSTLAERCFLAAGFARLSLKLAEVDGLAATAATGRTCILRRMLLPPERVADACSP